MSQEDVFVAVTRAFIGESKSSTISHFRNNRIKEYPEPVFQWSEIHRRHRVNSERRTKFWITVSHLLTDLWWNKHLAVNANSHNKAEAFESEVRSSWWTFTNVFRQFSVCFEVTVNVWVGASCWTNMDAGVRETCAQMGVIPEDIHKCLFHNLI